MKEIIFKCVLKDNNKKQNRIKKKKKRNESFIIINFHELNLYTE